LTNIILCGGNGTRLWPISRTLMPKQFVRLFENKSLFQRTIERNTVICDNNLIVSNIEQYFLALDQLEEIGQVNNRYLLEPIGRNTASAIGLACMSLDKDELVLVTPSDHLIKDEDEYKKVVDIAKILANKNNLVTFGITPQFAEIGFGYIESVKDSYDIEVFHEKPNKKTAQAYVDAGNYYWNSGMFMFKVGVFLEELQKYSPKIFEASKIAFDNRKTNDSAIRIEHKYMQEIPAESIDFAVMEKSKKVKVVPSNIGWSDVGSFDALYKELPQDENGNTKNDKHISIDSKNNFIYSKDKYIATIDVDNLVIVDTGDALLVSKKGSSQKVKEVVSEIQKNTELHNIHLTCYRPWGKYTVLEDTFGYKIKRIVVKPGKRLSLQKHYHRNEHWIVISGTATVIVGNETKLLRSNESTFIKMGEVHRLSNEGKIPVILIEAQVGEYTGEDDIIRIDDDFKRDE